MATGTTTGLALDQAALIALVTPGTATKNAGSSSGSIALSFSAASTVFDYLAKDEVLTLTYTVAIDDGDGGVTSQTFVVTITGTNDTSGGGDRGCDRRGDRAGNARRQPDRWRHHCAGPTSTSPILTRSRRPRRALGSLTASVNPTPPAALAAPPIWNYSVAAAAVEYLAKDQTKVETFTIALDDGNGGVVNRTIEVTITGTNDAPIVAADCATEPDRAGRYRAADRDDPGDVHRRRPDQMSVDVANITGAVASGTTTGLALGERGADRHWLTPGTGDQECRVVCRIGRAVVLRRLEVSRLSGQDEGETLHLYGGDRRWQRRRDVQDRSRHHHRHQRCAGRGGHRCHRRGDRLVTPVGNLTDSGTIGFTDVDLTDIHSISPAITASAGALGSLTASVTTDTTGSGLGGVVTWNYSVAAGAVEYLAKDQTKVETFTITLDDGNGGIVDRTIEVTITGTNDAPVLTV